MIHKDAQLQENALLLEKLERAATRDGFGKGVVEAAKSNERVVLLCADLAESTRSHWFKEAFPERYIEIGVAEQNLATVASGLAQYGKIPFITSYAAFSPGRNNEQIRTTVSLSNLPVKICGMHAGVSVGPDGATHQQLEDIALMRVQPNMTVIYPADVEEARKATVAAAGYEHPVYLRFARSNTPKFTTVNTPFEIGKSYELWRSEKPEVALIASGPLAHKALLAAQALSGSINTVVLNMHTIKPLDERAVLSLAKECTAVVTVEEHQIAGGVGSAVAEFLVQNYPVPMEFVGMHDAFGQSGEPEELVEHYGMGVSGIVEAVERAHERAH
ncbi:transketolase [Candidatus Kaiserbacteria bacterium CG10_big_fil_rev_8_21_14_0_10_49_17]|uniref:Transketolase n=1 Tax=Candidatus Kaiserbacteria bacterium CG10_big_fil_rev_8_21_14_0_10_49_17 TaxID=1974609 RepID=A0A2M6WEZ3_9BACT|nr:MAG: transketolase [Candidatus Kaiserbacteria bacterium CG10_big_fil_rev_8_21_14_0_10_49_17]